MTTQSEIVRLQRLANRRQATINRLRDELNAAKEMNGRIGEALNQANERAHRLQVASLLWQQRAAGEADTRMDPLEDEIEIVRPSLWQRFRAWVWG